MIHEDVCMSSGQQGALGAGASQFLLSLCTNMVFYTLANVNRENMDKIAILKEGKTSTNFSIIF